MKYWQIICSQHIKTVYQTKIKANHISDKKLINLIRALMSKYSLSDEEIVEEHLNASTKRHKKYITVSRVAEKIGESLHIGFYSQSADISITAQLTN
jgi:hypothetical protein